MIRVSEAVAIHQRGQADLPRLQELWEALFDHHISIGAAGLRTIERGRSWPLRRRHYEHLFASRPHTQLWTVERAAVTLGYALAYGDDVAGEPAIVLETLSVRPDARGEGAGTRLMERVTELERSVGAAVGAVDVLGGNDRARKLYLRSGYAPYSESWLRSSRSPGPPSPSPARDREFLMRMAARIGLALAFTEGPDDTWVSAPVIAELSALADSHGAALAGFPNAPHVFEPETDFPALTAVLDALRTAGMWTIRIEIPASPRAERLREFLRTADFRISTERLTRPAAETTRPTRSTPIAEPQPSRERI